MQKPLWRVLRQEEKRTQSRWPLGSSGRWSEVLAVEGEDSDTGVGILNQNYIEFPVLLWKYSTSRFSPFPAAPLWACANEASPVRAQRDVLLYHKVPRLTGAVSKSREAAPQCLLWLGDPFGLNFLRSLILEKSSGSQVIQRHGPDTHTAQLGLLCMEWHCCDYGCLVYQWTRNGTVEAKG